MIPATTTRPTVSSSRQTRGLRAYFPFLTWLFSYRRADLPGDLVAGMVVAIMLAPQGMAYALLAGLPPQVGLYASILPLIIYGLLGSSRVLSVGPVALVSLLTASAIAPLTNGNLGLAVQLALTLALLIALIQIMMGLARLGFLVNFISQPVLSGFTSAAAIVIGFSQIKHIVGMSMPSTDYFYETGGYLLTHLREINLVTLAIGLGSIAMLLYFRHGLSTRLRKLGMGESAIIPISKSAPLVVAVLAGLLVFALGLDARAGVKVVGVVPSGLPPLTMPAFNPVVWRQLLPIALTISLVSYMESISMAKSLASKRRQKINANQELIALGAANLGAAFSSGYPVTGGISRSAVNFSAGANTGLASIITAVLVALTLVFLTPFFYYLPQAVLAAIIIVAVVSMIDIATLRHVWRYNKADAASLIMTFLGVLLISIEIGIVIGVLSALILYLWRTSRPHMAVVGRLGNSESYRNVKRYNVTTCANVIALRIDENLYFANTKYLEDAILNTVVDRPEVDHLILIGTGINFIDASALETLESLLHELADAAVQLHLADIKDPVMDRLQHTDFIELVGSDHIHLSTHDAMKAVGCVT